MIFLHMSELTQVTQGFVFVQTNNGYNPFGLIIPLVGCKASCLSCRAGDSQFNFISDSWDPLVGDPKEMFQMLV